MLSIVEDDSRALWVGSSGQGLYRLEPATGRLRAFQHIEVDASSPSVDTITRLLFDRAGRLWLTTLDGLYRFDPATERFTNYRRTVNDAPASYEPIDEDERGALWLAAYGTGVYCALDPASGQFTTFSHGLASSGNYRLNTLHVDHTGAVWVGRQNGLDRFEPLTDTVTQFSEKDGLASNAVSCILEDARGDLWMGTSKGLSRLDVRRRTFKNYGQADGLPGPDLTGWSACFRSPDGEMYFGGFAGAVAFRPENVTDSSYIPPVVLTAFQLSGATVAVGAGSPLSRSIDYTNALRLSHRDTFSFEFSALSFRSPETNRYRYKLEGLDQAWHEVGSDQRIATYTTLAAGAYRFRVQGATGRGSWSEPGRTVSVTIEPPWWGTWWFRALVAVVTVLLVLAIYFARIRQIAHQFEIRLDERLTERLRIARDLHDTLLQRFHGVLLRFQTAYEMLPSRPAEAKESLGGAIDGAAEAITEGRDAVQGLRASTVEDQNLAEAIKALGEELEGSGNERESLPLRVDVQGSPRSLRPIVRDEIYRIAAEALRNAFRHAEAKQIEVELWYEEQWLRLRVRDNGKGIDPKFLGKEGHTGHYGLPGMRERATLMGAKFTVWTEPDSGTEVELSIPASRAYAAAPSSSCGALVARGETLWKGDPIRVMSSDANLIRVLVVDDHPVVRQGIAGLIAIQSDLRLVAEAATGREAIQQFRAHRPDVTLMDLQMPEMGGLDAIMAIRGEFPEAHIIVLTTYVGDVQALRALKAGARAYLLKNTLHKELLETIRAVHAGKKWLSPEVSFQLAEHATDESLTPAEIRVSCA